MKVIIKSVITCLLFSITLYTLYAQDQDVTPDFLKNKGVLLLAVGTDEYVCVINTGYEKGAYWFIIKGERNRALGNNLGQLAEIHTLMASANGKYLAVLSAGEGHPMVDVVDLPVLRNKSEYKVLHVLDPYPGTITLDHWEDSNLVIDTTVPLNLRKEDGRVDPDLMFSEPKKFILNVPTGIIEPVHVSSM